MSDTLEVPTEISEEPAPVTAATAPAEAPAPLSTAAAAVERCLNAFRTARDSQRAKGKYERDCHEAAKVAYRQAVPYDESLENIQALIACVAQGINFQIYERHESTQILYAAQVALGAHHRKQGRK